MFHCMEIDYFSNEFTSVGSFGTYNFKLIPSQPYAFYDNLSRKIFLNIVVDFMGN